MWLRMFIQDIVKHFYLGQKGKCQQFMINSFLNFSLFTDQTYTTWLYYLNRQVSYTEIL